MCNKPLTGDSIDTGTIMRAVMSHMSAHLTKSQAKKFYERIGTACTEPPAKESSPTDGPAAAEKPINSTSSSVNSVGVPAALEVHNTVAETFSLGKDPDAVKTDAANGGLEPRLSYR